LKRFTPGQTLPRGELFGRLPYGVRRAIFVNCCVIAALFLLGCMDEAAGSAGEPSEMPLADMPVTTPEPAPPTLTPAPAATSVRPSQVWGYVPEYDRPSAWASAQSNRAALSGVTVFQTHLDADGDLIHYPNVQFPDWLWQSQLTIVPMVTNHVGDRWDGDLVGRVISNPDRRRYHIDQIVNYAVDGGFSGIELDYENLSPAQREPFSTFVRELASALHSRGKQLTVAVHAKLQEPGEWDAPQAQDWAVIGAEADRIVVMTYDFDPARPGAISPLGWTRSVLQFAATRIPPNKIIQGIPLYGYDWSGGRTGVDVTYTQLLDLARTHGVQPRRDPMDHHLILEYTDRGSRHEIWLADADTVASLVQVGREVGVAGYALWRLGGEDASAWGVLSGIAR
jgi:spore germination protein